MRDKLSPVSNMASSRSEENVYLCNISGHNININNFTIVGREDQNLTRAIKETLFIRVNDPSLNRNIGKYHLPHIWDEVLHTTSELKLN